MTQSFATAILTNEFFMLNQEHNALLVIAVGNLEGKHLKPPYEANPLPYCISALSSSALKSTPLGKSPKGAIAVIPIQGTIMMDDFRAEDGTVYHGMKTFGQWAVQADNDPNIDGILFDVCSAGGMAMGCEQLHATIASLKKPTVALANGLMASAAYFVGSACDSIIANGMTTRVGSIGTMTSITDTSGMLAKMGIVKRDIYATASTDKNLDYRQALSGDDSLIQSQNLDPLNAAFHAAVRSGRGTRINTDKENVMSGKLYMGASAKKSGLVDSIGNFSSAVKYLTNSLETKKSNKMKLATKYAVFAATLGWETGFEATTEGVHVQEDSMALIETALTAGVTAQVNFELVATELAEATATIETMIVAANVATKSFATLTIEANALKVKVIALGKKPSGAGTAIKTKAELESESVTDEPVVASAGAAWLDAQLSKKKTDYNKLLNA